MKKIKENIEELVMGCRATLCFRRILSRNNYECLLQVEENNCVYYHPDYLNNEHECANQARILIKNGVSYIA